MFLTRKALKKIRLLIGTYFALGALSFVIAVIFKLFSIENKFIIILGFVCFLLGVFFGKIGRYSEGKGKLINIGNKLVNHQLRPAEFIHLYEEKRDSSENVVSKPDFDVLILVVTAYDDLGDTERELETLEKMLSIASEKKKPFVNLLKSSVLFSIGKIEEAEQLFGEVQNRKMDPITKMMSDIILKSDRAMALGDYKIAEIHSKQQLAQTFPKNTPLSLLDIHFRLAKIYYKTGRLDEAKNHYNYCVENGGETAIKSEAANMIKFL